MATEHGRTMVLVILVGLLCDFSSMTPYVTEINSMVMADLCGQRQDLWEPVVLKITFNLAIPERLRDCGVQLVAFPHQRLMVTIQDQYIVTRSRTNACNRFLKIRDGSHKDSMRENSFSGDICGDTRKRNSSDGFLHVSRHGHTVITTSDHVFFSFYVTADLIIFESSILISPFHEGQCKPGEYRCRNNRCVNEYLHCAFRNNLCDDKTSHVDDKCNIGSQTTGRDTTLFLTITVLMGLVLIVVIAAMCCCCYRCRQKRHHRRRRRRERQERRTLRQLSIQDPADGINNPGLQISPEEQLPAYLPSYPPPEYTTLPRSHGPPPGIADKPPDAEGPEADSPPSYDDVYNNTPPVLSDTAL